MSVRPLKVQGLGRVLSGHEWATLPKAFMFRNMVEGCGQSASRLIPPEIVSMVTELGSATVSPGEATNPLNV